MQSRSYLHYLRHSTQRPWISYSISLIILITIGTGLLDRVAPPPKLILPLVGLLLGWLAWEMYRGITQFWTASRSGFDNAYASYIGLGFALLGSCVVLTRLTGGLYSPFYPLLYLALAFLASVGTSRQGALWFGYAIMLEVAAMIASGLFQPGVAGIGALHLVFFAVFAGSHHVFLRGVLREMSEARNRKRTAETHMTKAPEAPVFNGPDISVTASSIASIDQEQQILLTRLKEGLDAHGCALLWLDNDGEHLHVMSIETDATHIQTGPFSVRTGVPASLFKNESTLRLSRSGDHPLHLPYYDHDVQALSWLAVPIRQGQTIRGALCVDRIHPVPFSSREEMVLEATATILARAILNERTLQREAQDLEHLTLLSETGRQLSEATTTPALAELALELAAGLVPFQWGLLTIAHDAMTDEDENLHTVLSTTPKVAYLYEQTFDAHGSLLSLACKFGYPLPKQGILETNGPLLSETPLGLPDAASLTIIPLQDRHGILGCLILGAEEPRLFADRENEKKLGVFAQQLTGCFANLQSQKQLEHLSHNDSLTGLANHSTFMERLTDCFATPHHATPQLALMMFNIDNFHYINERYGHITGDLVLRRIAKLFQEMAEPGDVVARYSGEEIAFLCKGFQLSQALKFADHVCHQIARIDMCSSDVDPEIFSVTVSAGLACSPEHAADANTLLRHATEALLQAKQRGGNQAVLIANSDDGIALATPNPDARPSVSSPPGWGWGSLPPSDDPRQLQDPERWSLTSFSKPPPVSSSSMHHYSNISSQPIFDEDPADASNAVLQPAQLPPAPIQIPQPAATPKVDEDTTSNALGDILPLHKDIQLAEDATDARKTGDTDDIDAYEQLENVDALARPQMDDLPPFEGIDGLEEHLFGPSNDDDDQEALPAILRQSFDQVATGDTDEVETPQMAVSPEGALTQRKLPAIEDKDASEEGINDEEKDEILDILDQF